MAGTLTFVRKQTYPKGGSAAYILDWLTDAAGANDQDISALTGALGGRIIAVETIPGQNGDLTTDLPTNLYDIAIDDEYATDVMAGALANQSGTVGARTNPANPPPIWDPLVLDLTNGGNAKQGRLIIVVED